MKKLLPLAVLTTLAIWVGCSSDEEPPPNGPVTPTVVRVIANTTAGAPLLQSADEIVWDSVAGFAIDVSTLNSPKMPQTSALVVSDSVYVKAIVAGPHLYLRLEYDNDSLNLLKDHYRTIDNNLNFSHDTLLESEDHVYVMFEGFPDSSLDVWKWSSLTTASAGLAEGLVFKGGSMIVDTQGTGGQIVAFPNGPNPNNPSTPEPVYVDTANGPSSTRQILYLEDRGLFDSSSRGAYRQQGLIVPGWYVDTLVGIRVQSPTYASSRWNVWTVYSYDAVNERLAIVFKRALSVIYTDDYTFVDSVKMKIGILDDQDDLKVGGSRRGFTPEFWLIL